MVALFPSAQNLPVGEVVSILWRPPFSALNGWSEQPSEIAQSYLVSARVLGAAAHARHQNEYSLEIASNEPFLLKLQSLCPGMNEEWALPKVLDARTNPPRAFLTWDEVAWCGMANIAGLTYLVANTSAEANMELIVDAVDGELFGLFSAHCDPGGTSYNLGRRKLSGPECHAVSTAMEKAVQLVDSYRQYLVL